MIALTEKPTKDISFDTDKVVDIQNLDFYFSNNNIEKQILFDIVERPLKKFQFP